MSGLPPGYCQQNPTSPPPQKKAEIADTALKQIGHIGPSDSGDMGPALAGHALMCAWLIALRRFMIGKKTNHKSL
jgi:hypothetical protein